MTRLTSHVPGVQNPEAITNPVSSQPFFAPNVKLATLEDPAAMRQALSTHPSCRGVMENAAACGINPVPADPRSIRTFGRRDHMQSAVVANKIDQ